MASIKRVIAEDGRAAVGAPKGRGKRAESPADQVPAEEDVLELSNPIVEEDGLMSDNATAASRQALAALVAARPGDESVAPAGSASEGPLEALVKDMLRPMLKDWLDQRLPEMVEELVTREIARITGKSL